MSNPIAFPSPAQALALIEAAASSRLSASIGRIVIRPRPSWDGEGFDIAWDFRCTWCRGNDPSDHGAHSGTVRATAAGMTADLYGGHYDLTSTEAEEELRGATGTAIYPR